MPTKNFVAFDLGAESGRAVVGSLSGEQLSLHEVYRFPNRPVRVAGHLHWDVLRLFDEIQTGLSRALQECGEIASVGLDTWGVDFALLDQHGILIGNPYHYRDHRTDGILDKAWARVPREQIFQATGIQFMQINTLFQLYAMVLAGDPALQLADRLLMTPDLFNYWLSGEKVSEFTIATTSQCFDTRNRVWATGLLEQLGIPTPIFPPIIQPASEIGALVPAVADRLGGRRVKVIAPGCHDTASAVAAVPASTDHFAYISSGTWSVMGIVSPEPVITPLAHDFNFTNEGGVGGTIRLLTNITGLWLVQECRRAWARAGDEQSYDTLTSLAAQARPLQALIDPGHSRFLNPDDMPQAIRKFCADTGQSVPQARGDLVRVALESLACKYRMSLGQLEQLTGHRLEAIHIVGGGSQNGLLCQFTADACARPVYAGPVEATALGNVLAQALAGGDCASWPEAREWVRRDFPLIEYAPRDTAAWDEAYARFLRVLDTSARI